MTNEQAIELLMSVKWNANIDEQEDKALSMAIEALRFADEYHQSNIEAYARDMGVSLEQAERELRVEELSCSEKPNRSDLISRTRLLTDLQETVEAWSKYPVMEEEIKGVEIAIGYVKNIPSANIDLSGYSDRLWKSAYDRGYARCKDDVIEALIEKGQASKRYSLSEEWELNYTEICDVIEDLPSAQPEKSTTDEKSQLAEENSTRKLIYLDEAIDVAKQHWYKPDIAKALEELPSAQPEIIRCEYCKFAINVGTTDMMCKNSKGWVVATDNSFGCILAERRTDE